MGQKANVNSLHVSKQKDWNCVWYSNDKEYKKMLSEDITLFNYLKSCNVFIKDVEILKVRICRISNNIVVHLELTNSLMLNRLVLLRSVVSNLNKIFNGRYRRILLVSKVLSSHELKVDAIFLAKKIARFIEKRIKFKSYLIRNLVSSSFLISKGIKVSSSGRFGGADIASSDSLSLGSIPFQSLKAQIEYGFCVANTPKGLQGIKVWVCK
jgi:small subunit ribosomal protein S3